MTTISKCTAVQQSQDGETLEVGNKTLCDVLKVVGPLTSDRAWLQAWIQKAWTHYNKDSHDQFLVLLEEALNQCAKSYEAYKEDALKIFTLLSAHFIRLTMCDSIENRVKWVAKIKTMFLQMDMATVVNNEIPHMLCRGFGLMLLQLKLEKPDAYFDSVLGKDPNNLLTLLGSGYSAFRQGDYHGAVDYFKSVGKHYSQGPIDMRVAIAQCFYKSGDLVTARCFFEVALEINVRYVNTLLGMARIRLSDRQRLLTVDAMNLLTADVEVKQRKRTMLTWFPAYFYQNFERPHILELINPVDCSIKAENCIQTARIFHAHFSYKRAFELYEVAADLRPDLAPPHLGLAQIYVRRGELQKAEQSLVTLLKLVPRKLQALCMLASLYVETATPAKLGTAVEFFNKALEVSKRGNHDIWLGLAAAYQRMQQWLKAIDACENAVRVYQDDTAGDAPIEWLNNIAALQMRAKLPTEALQTVERALVRCHEQHSGVQDGSYLPTLKFNKARILEELRFLEQAESCYKMLIKEYPKYYDGYLRLGVMAYMRNEVDCAVLHFKDVLNQDSGNANAKIYLGYLYTRNGQLSHVLQYLNVFKPGPVSYLDFFINVAVASVHLIHAEEAISVGLTEFAKHYVTNVKELFTEARNKRNALANGIGGPESSHEYVKARETFLKSILEAGYQSNDAVLKTAQVAFKQERFSDAVEVYKRCLNAFLPVNCRTAMELLTVCLAQTGIFEDLKHWQLRHRPIVPLAHVVHRNVTIALKLNYEQDINRLIGLHAGLQGLKQNMKVAKIFLHYLAMSKEFSRLVNCAKRRPKQLVQVKELEAVANIKEENDNQLEVNLIQSDEVENNPGEENDEADNQLEVNGIQSDEVENNPGEENDEADNQLDANVIQSDEVENNPGEENDEADNQLEVNGIQSDEVESNPGEANDEADHQLEVNVIQSDEVDNNPGEENDEADNQLEVNVIQSDEVENKPGEENDEADNQLEVNGIQSDEVESNPGEENDEADNQLEVNVIQSDEVDSNPGETNDESEKLDLAEAVQEEKVEVTQSSEDLNSDMDSSEGYSSDDSIMAMLVKDVDFELQQMKKEANQIEKSYKRDHSSVESDTDEGALTIQKKTRNNDEGEQMDDEEKDEKEEKGKEEEKD